MSCETPHDIRTKNLDLMCGLGIHMSTLWNIHRVFGPYFLGTSDEWARAAAAVKASNAPGLVDLLFVNCACTCCVPHAVFYHSS